MEDKMGIIKIIRDEDLGFTSKPLVNPKVRIAARGIIVNENQQIAIVHKRKKNEFKLPGGGVEGNETFEEAFIREAKEETGCEIEILEAVGTIHEEKSKDSFKQISYVFFARVTKDTNILALTEKEQNEGSEVLWVSYDEGLKLIYECYDKVKESSYESLYQTKFIVYRDRLILEYYDCSFTEYLEQ